MLCGGTEIYGYGRENSGQGRDAIASCLQSVAEAGRWARDSPRAPDLGGRAATSFRLPPRGSSTASRAPSPSTRRTSKVSTPTTRTADKWSSVEAVVAESLVPPSGEQFANRFLG